jgi:PKD repeat protein
MKLGFLLSIIVFSVSFFQNGCGNANNLNQASVSNQNVVITSPTPTPSSPTATPFQNRNTVNNGASEEEVRDVLELNERCKHAPVSKAKVTPITGTAPLTVTFDGSSSYDPDGTKIVKWEWHFGNGKSGEGEKITYIYEKPGKYYIGLKVTDMQGQKNSDCGTGATDISVFVIESKNTNENSVQKEN